MHISTIDKIWINTLHSDKIVIDGYYHNMLKLERWECNDYYIMY